MWNAPAEVLQDQGRGAKEDVEACTDESSNRAAKGKLKNVWVEDGGCSLYRYGPTATTIFDTWVLIGEPLPTRGRG